MVHSRLYMSNHGHVPLHDRHQSLGEFLPNVEVHTIVQIAPETHLSLVDRSSQFAVILSLL